MNEDNLKMAMDKEAETTLGDMTVSKSGEDIADKQVLIRATQYDKDRWKASADAKGLTVSEWIRSVLNDAARNTLDCSHPINRRRYYPWAEFCLECNMRLRG
jgi:predicted DNA binding CopG/RHH family protein